MKVLFVCSSCGGGGAEKVAVRLSNALCQFGHNVVYAYWKTKKNLEYDIRSDVKIEKVHDSNILSRILNIKRVIEKTKPDVIFSFADIPNIITYYAHVLSKHKCKIVPNVRTNVAERYRYSKKGLYNLVQSRLHEKVCRRSDLTIVNSIESGKALSDCYKVSPDRIFCIYNPVFLNLDLPCFHQRLQKSGCQETLTAITVGRLSKAKNHHMLLKAVHYAIKEFNVSISLDIYGEGELRDEILSEISQLDMEGHIFLRGFDKEIEKKIHQYDIFLFTSRWEGLPNALIEALGSGVSIVATDCPSGPKEILKDGRFGKLVGVDDFKAMAENISEIYYHHDISIRTRDMEPQSSIELREHLKQFTIPCVANRYIEVALRLIG